MNPLSPPPKLPAKQMLHFYGEHFRTVESNYTFKRLPTASVVAAWLSAVPADFQFALKAPELITHRKRLKNVGDALTKFLDVAGKFKKCLGPLLFQLPPNFKKDLPRLAAFLELFRDGPRIAFEFRHESWFDDEVYDSLRDRSCALCVADAEDLPAADLVDTAGWGYLRLRREDYTPASLADWLHRIRAQKWSEVYVLFRHEDSGAGPAYAKQLQNLFAAS